MKWLVKEWKNLQTPNLQITVLLICFYVFGVAGINHPYTRNLFEPLSAFTLLYSSVALLFTHGFYERKFFLFTALAFISGMVVEIVGVHTGAIFGEYKYTDMLGWRLCSVPFVIGANWFALAYAANNVVMIFLQNKMIAALTSAVIITAFDVLIEPLAIRHHYWIWTEDGSPPLQNFLAWFFISAFLSLVYQFSIPKKFNFTAFVFLMSLAFFLLTDYIISYFE